jgi:FkbM family methyltransferase
MISSLRVAFSVFYITSNIHSKLFIFFVLLHAFIRKFFPLKPRSFDISIRFGGNILFFNIRGIADLAALYEVFVKKEYEFETLSEVRVIVDLGANIGDTAVYFASMYPNARVYAIEADPAIFEVLKMNTLSVKNITPVFGAISSYTGSLDFFVNASSLSGSVFERNGTSKKVSVPCFSLKDFMNRQGVSMVDIIKFDIEGGEYEFFDSSMNDIQKSRLLIGEVHPDIAGRAGDDIVKKLNGFHVIKTPTHGERFIITAKK